MRKRDDLAWMAEMACTNAWPAPRQVLLDGWLLRASGGPTRRTNSLNPLRGPRGAHGPTIAACERIYASLDQPAIVRVPGIATDLDRPLECLGYRPEGEARTLFSGLDGLPAVPDPGVRLAAAPDAAWLDRRARLAGTDPEGTAIYAAMTACIALPKAFAAVAQEGGLAAMAYAVVDGPLVVIESVATVEAFRGQGLARRVVAALMLWGRARGAVGACLQVAADNRAAGALYERLGFRTELYRYHYRRQSG